MKKALCALGILLVALAAYPAFVFMSHQRYYGEAEPLADRLVMLRRELSVLKSEGQKLPATVPELLQLLPEKDRQRFDGYHIIWQPEADPILKMRVNKKFGLTLDAEGNIQWVTKPAELEAIGPAN